MSENPTATLPIPQLGAIILCGGKSSRMGSDKAQLLFHGRTFLDHTISALQKVAKSIVVVGSFQQSPPALPSQVQFVRDRVADKGPLEGMVVGLQTLIEIGCEAAFVSACDSPLLKSAVVLELFQQLNDHQVVLPTCQSQPVSLTAIYRESCLGIMQSQLDQGLLSVQRMVQELDHHTIDIDHFRDIDSQLESFLNINSRQDYADLLNRYNDS